MSQNEDRRLGRIFNDMLQLSSMFTTTAIIHSDGETQLVVHWLNKEAEAEYLRLQELYQQLKGERHGSIRI